MAKGGYQKRRIAEKKAAERAHRKRAARRKTMLTTLVVIAVLAMIGGIVLATVVGDDEGSLADPDASVSPSLGPTGQLPEDCTAAEPADEAPRTYKSPPSMVIDRAKTYTATLETSCGTIEVELLDDDAPKTVNNFVFLAREGFFDGSIWHRVIPEFAGSAMIQGGDPVNDTGTGDAGYKFEDENTIPFDEPGYLAMANSGPNTNGSQFFILDETVGHLNNPDPSQSAGNHSVFGRVTEGLDVVGRIAGVPKDPADPQNSTPLIDVVLISVTINES